MRVILISLLAVTLAAPAAPLGAQTRTGNGAAAAAAGTPDFVPAAGDLLRIRVWPDSALGGEFLIEASGLVHLPVIGAFPAAGRPVSELQRALRQRYAADLKAPVVTVTPLFRVSVLGAVQRPGVYQVDPTYGLFDVISLAGGFRPDATDEVRILRGGETIEVNTASLLATTSPRSALAVQSGDRIVVPERRRLDFRLVLQVLTLAVSIVSLARR